MGITQAGDKRTGVAHPTSKRERQARRGSVERQCNEQQLEQDNDDVCGRVCFCVSRYGILSCVCTQRSPSRVNEVKEDLLIKSLVRRMVVLERNIKQSQGGSLARVQELALTMLSDSELEALQTVNVLLGGNGGAALTGAQEIVWERWDDALAVATKKLHCPVELTAMDLRL